MSNLASMILSAQSAPAFFTKDSKKGASVIGTIESVQVRQVREVGTNKLLFWEDNSPQEQLVIILAPYAPADGEVSEPVTVYIKWWGAQRKDFAKAVLDAGAVEPTIGSTLRVTYEGEAKGEVKPGLNKEKMFSYEYAAA